MAELTLTCPAAATTTISGAVTSLNTLQGDLTVTGTGGISIITESPTITVSGFQTEFISASGSLQSQIDAGTAVFDVEEEEIAFGTATSGIISSEAYKVTVDKPSILIVGSGADLNPSFFDFEPDVHFLLNTDAANASTLAATATVSFQHGGRNRFSLSSQEHFETSPLADFNNITLFDFTNVGDSRRIVIVTGTAENDENQLILHGNGRVSIYRDFTAAAQEQLHVGGGGLFEGGDLRTDGTVSGIAADIGDLVAVTGTFSQSLTISGLPVLTEPPSDNPFRTRTVTLENPSDSEDFTLLYTNDDVVINRIDSSLVGTLSPSLNWTLRFAPTRTDTGTEVTAGGFTTNNVGVPDTVTSFTNPTITGGSYLWLETTSVTPSINLFSATISFD